MTKEQVKMLRDAGISEEAIINRILSEPGTEKPDAEEKKPADEKETKPAQDPAPETKPEQEKKTEPEKKPETEDRILKAIEKLTGAVLSKNINTIGRDDTPEESADDVLGALFRGEPNNKGGK